MEDEVEDPTIKREIVFKNIVECDECNKSFVQQKDEVRCDSCRIVICINPMIEG